MGRFFLAITRRREFNCGLPNKRAPLGQGFGPEAGVAMTGRRGLLVYAIIVSVSGV